jgi:hypothetical protein
VIVVAIGAAMGQTGPDPVTVPFSDPSRPGRLRVGMIEGSIKVTGSNRRDVAIVARPRGAQPRDGRADGLRRLPQPPAFSVQEDANEMSVQSDSPNVGFDFEIQAPARTSLKLSTVNSGEIVVASVEGEMVIDNTNGSITLTGVAGSVVANTTNGDVIATLTRVTDQKAMAFTSFNGKVDVTLPAATRANLKLRSDNADVFTDFDVQLRSAPSAVQDTKREGGRYRISVNKSIYGSINGGGPDIELRTYNGNVYVRKGK